MTYRKRIYYPDSQIKKGLFTKGEEWMTLDDWKEYIGLYHIYESTGEVFTESEWHPTKSKQLVKFKRKSPEYYRYVDLVNYTIIDGQKTEVYGPIKLDRYSAPRAVLREPDLVEKEKGLMTRYFLFKRNEKNTKKPIEIDKNQADTYPTLNYGINQYLYELVEIPWKIEGPEFDVMGIDGILKTPGVVNTNERIVKDFSRKFPILESVLTNYRQFSIYDR